MKIPEFQPGQPMSDPKDRAGLRRTAGEVSGTDADLNEHLHSTLPPGEAVSAVDTVDFSALSLAILENRNPISPLSKSDAYSLDNYVVNPERLAQALVKASLISRNDGD
ncbi:MAG: hypothetical protein LC114_15580 [Bryobacterales bacterium]|nr:hypothetical protein [Bryobacterales bacterium]